MLDRPFRQSLRRWGLALALLAGSLATSAIAGPLMNLTVIVPSGSTTYGRPGLLCVPADWKEITQL